jgi:hypothetical protein
MSHAEDVLFHRGEGGWFVLSSRVPELGGDTPQFAEHLLARMNLSRPVACLVLDSEGIPDLGSLLEELEALLGVQPAVLDAALSPPPELAGVSMMILAGGSTRGWIETLSGSKLGELVLSSLANGAILLALGAAAGAFGSGARIEGESGLVPGLGWLVGAVILPGNSNPSEFEPVRQYLEDNPRAYALGLAESALVAIGPDGEIEVWGESQPTIILGVGWVRG